MMQTPTVPHLQAYLDCPALRCQSDGGKGADWSSARYDSFPGVGHDGVRACTDLVTVLETVCKGCNLGLRSHLQAAF